MPKRKERSSVIFKRLYTEYKKNKTPPQVDKLKNVVYKMVQKMRSFDIEKKKKSKRIQKKSKRIQKKSKKVEKKTISKKKCLKYKKVKSYVRQNGTRVKGYKRCIKK